MLPDLPAGAVRYHEQSIDRSLCGKWAACKSLLDHWRPNNEPNDNKVLIFSMSVKLLKILEFFVNLAGYSYEFMHGGVPSDRRMEMVSPGRLQGGPKYELTLHSLICAPPRSIASRPSQRSTYSVCVPPDLRRALR